MAKSQQASACTQGGKQRLLIIASWTQEAQSDSSVTE